MHIFRRGTPISDSCGMERVLSSCKAVSSDVVRTLASESRHLSVQYVAGRVSEGQRKCSTQWCLSTLTQASVRRPCLAGQGHTVVCGKKGS